MAWNRPAYTPSWMQPKQKDLDAIKKEFSEDPEELATEICYLREAVENLQNNQPS